MPARLIVMTAMILAAVGIAGAQDPESPEALRAPTCVPPGGNAVFTAELSPESTWSQVRLYFRKAGEGDYYYLDMRSDVPGSYWTTLPWPASETAAAETFLSATTVGGAEIAGDILTVPVEAGCLTTLTPNQQAFADNLVVGETTAAQADNPVLGWECEGIVIRRGIDDLLRPDEVCRRVLMAAGAEQAGLVAEQRGGLLLPLLGGIGGGYIIADQTIDRDDCDIVSPVMP